MQKFADEKEMNRLDMLKKKAAKLAAGSLDDDDKTIGELIREMNMPKKDEGFSGETDPAFSQGSEMDVHTYKIDASSADSRRKTEVKGSEEIAGEGLGTNYEKQHFSELIWALRKFMSSLHEREIKKLNSLLPHGEEGIITQSVNVLEKLLDKNDFDPAELNAQILNIISSLEKIGSVRQKHGIIEDTENLIMIELNLHLVEEGCHTVLIKSVKDGSAGSKAITSSIGKLFSVVQNKKVFVAGLVAAFDKFRRR